jgi:RNA polymerase sigma-70 factor (ECF subfamily)
VVFSPAWLFARKVARESPPHRGKRFFAQPAIDATVASPVTTAATLPLPPPVLPRLAAGESRAMHECIDRFGGLIWSIVRRSIRNETEAEDLVQQILTEIWKTAGTYNPMAGTESTFVAMIARRRTIDALRKSRREPAFEPLETAADLPAATSAAPTTHDAEAVRSSLACLPDDTRDLFRLFFEEGFTHPEIADKTGLPLGTVKTRLRRGLLAIREKLLHGNAAAHPHPVP